MVTAGTNSYTLFTLDKLIAKVMKAFQGLMQDPLSVKLFDMYKYECSRSVPFNDAVYHANVHVVLHEDHCFRLQSQPDGLLSVQMLDPDKTEVPASEPFPTASCCCLMLHVEAHAAIYQCQGSHFCPNNNGILSSTLLFEAHSYIHFLCRHCGACVC